MNKIITKLRILSQFSFKQSLLLIIGVFLRKLVSKIPNNIFRMNEVFTHIFEENGSSYKNSCLNIVTFKKGNESNKCRICLRRMTSDFYVFEEIFLHQNLSPLIDMIKKDNAKINYIIDAGANIGGATIFLKSIFPEATVFPVEPEYANFDMLLKNIEVNSFKKVIPIKAGLWIDNSDLKVTSDFGECREWSFSLKPNCLGSEIARQTVKGITMADILKKYLITQIDILKIDIEGAERALFEDEETAGLFLPFVKYLAMEIHYEDRIKENIVTLLKSFGYKYFFKNDLIFAKNSSENP